MNDTVVRHYSQDQSLLETIRARLIEAGKDLECLTTNDLAPIDEFHIRGRAATLELAAAMDLKASHRVLDLGSGLGGPARTLAQTFDCDVTGIDLTPAYTHAASAMSHWVRLAEQTRFLTGDVTALPGFDTPFDRAITIHVAMNIADKSSFYREVRKVLKPGGVFGLYDVVQGEGGDVLFPVPWARDPSISHLVTLEVLKTLLQSAGFIIDRVIDSTNDSTSWFANMAAWIQEHGLPPLSLHAIMGHEFKDMSGQLVQNLQERRVRTVMMVARAPVE